MKKLLLFLSLAVSIAVNTVELSAKQTVEEATDSIKAILDNAKKGDSEAQNEVGRWYYIGRHFKQNYSEAIKWWSLSAKQGNIKAIGNMAVCYRLGHGVDADSVTSAKLMLKSIEKGNKALLQRNMDAAKKGDLFADMILFNCYSNGIGVTKNPDKAISYLTDAANRNSVTAQRDLGMTLLNNKKYPEAAQWFKKGDRSCVVLVKRYTGLVFSLSLLNT